jgi:hypothetical protein
MKTIFFSLGLFIFFTGTMVCAQENMTWYPPIVTNGTVLLNGGIGYGFELKGEKQILPLTLSCDYALPIASLPFTVGIITGLSIQNEYKAHANLGAAFRLAYHLNLSFPYSQHADIYPLVTAGYIVAFGNGGVFWGGLGGGGRYFFTPRLGAFLELSINTLNSISAGVPYKL